jgi:hypothetical protein
MAAFDHHAPPEFSRRKEHYMTTNLIHRPTTALKASGACFAQVTGWLGGMDRALSGRTTE